MKPTILFIVGSLVALAVAVMISDDIACYWQELLGLREKHDVLKFIGFCIAGVVSIWLALSADKRANAMDATAKNTETGQRQERLKNAIEHLGHKRDSVRMGGAHELFHLAKDMRNLRRTVLDILCAHIRQTTRGKDYQAEHETKPSEEIQSLLRLLFVQKHDVFEGCSINLQDSYLNGANLFQARLKEANLIEAQLQEADLSYAQLQRAKLYRAQLQGAKLYRAQLQGAKLRYAQLQGAVLRYAQLQGAVLMEAKLQGADLKQARLQGADLKQARLQGADLKQAKLQSADLMEAQLQGAKLRYAQLQGVSSQADHIISTGFESRMGNRIGKDSDLTEIIFAGGLKEEDLDALCEGLSDDHAQALRETLRPHVGQPVSHELPENSGAEIDAYTQEEAEQWIAEYQAAMREVPKRDDS